MMASVSLEALCAPRTTMSRGKCARRTFFWCLGYESRQQTRIMMMNSVRNPGERLRLTQGARRSLTQLFRHKDKVAECLVIHVLNEAADLGHAVGLSRIRWGRQQHLRRHII